MEIILIEFFTIMLGKYKLFYKSKITLF